MSDQYIKYLPKTYLDWVETNDIDELENGYILYSGPIPANAHLEASPELENIVLIGDDMSGTFIAYRVTGTTVELVEFYIRDLEMKVLDKTFLEFVQSSE